MSTSYKKQHNRGGESKKINGSPRIQGAHLKGNKKNKGPNGNGSKQQQGPQTMIDELERGKKINGLSRKNQVSISHLLSFQSYEELAEYLDRREKEKRNGANRTKKNNRDVSRRVHLSGMSFINVNYKFVVDFRNDYAIQKLDSNVAVDLEDVLQIIAPRGNACPICLSDDPVAPRMLTACGHILCLRCLLSLLESEVPNFKKKESTVIVEKYKECPLCFSIIRSHQVKPVIIDNVDERFEIPQVNEDVVLTLMARPQDKFLALPLSKCENEPINDDFPSVYDFSEFRGFLRIFKGDLDFILEHYKREIEAIVREKETDRSLYNEEDEFHDLAIKSIYKDIEAWKEKFGTHEVTSSDEPSVHPMNFSNSYYFYETGFNASSVFVLSPLDMKVLKSSFGDDYKCLPTSVVARVENIRYEDLTEEDLISRYKFLSHLPRGTSLGFLECNWKGNDAISKEVWKTFKADLTKRSKNSVRKFRKEDAQKLRAMTEEEIRTREFFERQNMVDYHSDEYDGTSSYIGGMGSLTIIDNRNLPQLESKNKNIYKAEEQSTSDDLQETVWGTKIPKQNSPELLEHDEWHTDDIIQKAKDEMLKLESQQANGNLRRKKKKKLILLSSNSTW